MIILLSPSKTLDESPLIVEGATQPQFLKEASQLVAVARKLKQKDLEKLMDISPKLAALNVERFANFKTPFTAKTAKAAVYLFKGDVYDGLAVEQFKKADIAYAQQHLRILSGLYGLLRPLDLMQPYRLEMGISLKNPKGKNLYTFWGDTLTRAVNEAAEAAKSKLIINLASQEYFSAIHPKKLAYPLITPVFKESRNGKLATIGLMAKRARGTMAAWLIHERIQKPADIQNFSEDGYRFQPKLSAASELVFVR